MVEKKSPTSDHQIASIQEKRNALMRKIKQWRELQFIYMPGAVTTPLRLPEDSAEDNDIETAETVPLLLPSSLDPASRERVCRHQIAEHERLFRMAQLQDSLIELRHTRKIRRTLLVNHYTQVAGQGQRVNTRSRTVLNGVESRIAKFVKRYRTAYQALLQLDPTGNWQETFLELKDSDNRGPGKESDEEGVGDGSYFRSWIWLSNPRAPGATDGGEECASEEEVNEVLRVEWTTSFARLERWAEEVELLQEEMRRVVMFLEWKAGDWLGKNNARAGKLALDVQSGVNAYARKQAAVYHNLAISFAKLWRPVLVLHCLQHSWVMEYLTKNGVPFVDAAPSARTRGAPKSGPSSDSHSVPSAVLAPSDLLSGDMTINHGLLLEEESCSGDSDLEDTDSDSEVDLDDDLDF